MQFGVGDDDIVAQSSKNTLGKQGKGKKTKKKLLQQQKS